MDVIKMQMCFSRNPKVSRWTRGTEVMEEFLMFMLTNPNKNNKLVLYGTKGLIPAHVFMSNLQNIQQKLLLRGN